LHHLAQQEASGRGESQTRFTPAVDIYEDEQSITLKLDVAGIDEKDIEVKLENNTLSISGERKFESEEKTENYRRVERRYGRFGRAFTLPQTIDNDSVTAKCDKGVLKIRLVKKAEAKPKQIKIDLGKPEAESGNATATQA
jgi:HSP20 family protein